PMEALGQRLPVPEPAARRCLRGVCRSGRFPDRDLRDLASGKASARARCPESCSAVRPGATGTLVHYLDRLHRAQAGRRVRLTADGWRMVRRAMPVHDAVAGLAWGLINAKAD